MPCVARLLALCVGLAAWPGAGALAQDAPGSGAPSSVRLIDVVPSLINERRYRVEALRFKARDETGFDWAGSDEVMVDVCDDTGCTTSDEIGGIDSGDVHEFLAARSCVFGVVPGEVVLGRSSFCDIDDPGRPAPVRLRVEFWEKDDVGIDFGFCAVVVGQSHHWPSHCADDGRGDDLIGWTDIEFPIKEIEAALPLVGDQLVETVALNPCEPGVVCAGWDLGDYSFTFRVTRVPDGKGFPRLELAEAVRRTGAASEFDAVLAALRLVPEPTRRRIDWDEMGDPGGVARD